MWPKQFRDYPQDTPLVLYPVWPGRALIGCEMHELNGWGNTLHIPQGTSVPTGQPYKNQKESHYQEANE